MDTTNPATPVIPAPTVQKSTTDEILKGLGINVTPQDPTKLFRKQKFIMVGDPKLGKTKFWASAGPKAYFLRTEAGHSHVSTVGEDCRSWADLVAARAKLMKAKNMLGALPFDIVVLDTGDRFVDLVNDDVISRARERFTKIEINSIGEIPEGVGWFMATTQVKQYLKQLEDLEIGVAIIFHVAQDERDDELTGKKYKKDQIGIGGKTGMALAGWPDHIMHVRAAYIGDQLVRKVVMRGSKTIQAGSRLKSMPPELRWVDDDQKNFDEFRKLFD